MYKVRYTNSSTEIPEFPIAPEIALELLMAANFLDCWFFQMSVCGIDCYGLPSWFYMTCIAIIILTDIPLVSLLVLCMYFYLQMFTSLYNSPTKTYNWHNIVLQFGGMDTNL